MTLTIAFSFSSPAAILPSTSVLNWFNWSATAAFNAIIADAQFAEEPIARNSKRLPVNAKGEVRLRSVLSISNSGICVTFSIFIPDLRAKLIVSSSVLTSWSMASETCRPKNIEIIAGGASFAPRRCSLVADEMDALSNPLKWLTAAITLARNVMNCRLSLGVFPGLKSIVPVSVPKLQLLCLPEPFTPLNGFSCNSTWKL